MNKTLNILLRLFCFLTIVSCNKEVPKDDGPTVDTVAAIEPDILPVEKPKFDYYQYYKDKIIQTLYVTNRNGVEIKEQADSTSKSVGLCDYGTKLDVIEIDNEWLAILYDSRDQRYGKFYVQKKFADSLNKVKLTDSDLNIVYAWTINEKTDFKEYGMHLNKFLELELVGKTIFEREKSLAVNYFNSDTAAIKKKNGEISLNCKSRTVKIIDKPSESDDVAKYEYLGQFDFLNKYLIKGSYYEGDDYKFIDKITCEETQVFNEFPYVSADKKHIICIYSNIYELNCADLQFYSVLDNKTKVILETSFKNWVPSGEKEGMFWGRDGQFYCSVIHSKALGQRDKQECQYIRIKIL